jgi:3-oxoadipate CoA-transferase alpha subunit
VSRALVLQTTDEAVAGIEDGSTVLVGGFGLAGMPFELIDALIRQGAKDLTIVSNNAGNGDVGLAALLAAGQVSKVICSFPRQVDSWVFDGLYRAGKIELEVVPQGNLAERMRAAGAGIGAFFCPTAAGTPLADGKETREIDGRTYVLEYPIKGDYALIAAHRADTLGNLVTARRRGTSARSWQPRRVHDRQVARWSRSAPSTRRPSSPLDLRRPDRQGRGPSPHRAGAR